MYKAIVKAMIKRDLAALNAGDSTRLQRKVAPDAELTFPGDNSWARQFRPVSKGREATVTHRGTAEIEAFGERFVATRLALEVDDILIGGPPWRTRVCVRATDEAVDEAGRSVYVNRLVAFIETRWGKIRRWEDYLDTERVRAWDELIDAGSIVQEPTVR